MSEEIVARIYERFDALKDNTIQMGMKLTGEITKLDNAVGEQLAELRKEINPIIDAFKKEQEREAEAEKQAAEDRIKSLEAQLDALRTAHGEERSAAVIRDLMKKQNAPSQSG